jgi:hypothetical protein
MNTTHEVLEAERGRKIRISFPNIIGLSWEETSKTRALKVN